MEVVVGTYDEVILGFRVIELENQLQIEASFTDHSHAGCVKCVAISSKGVLASGSTDETIRLLNIKKQKELGSLVHHNGTVTSLEFHKGFLFSTSEDNNLCLWKTFTWECLRTFKGHKAAVDYVSVHPSGKLALTVGRDKVLHTWNLITGRSAYITNLKQVASIVKWSPDGDTYAIVIGNTINIYSVETADIILTIKSDVSINSLVFLNDEMCCYGGEEGYVIFHDIKQDKQLHKCETGTNRVKCFCISTHNLKHVTEKRILCTVSSDGLIKLYKIIENKKIISTELLLEHSTGFRVTCLAVLGKDEEKSSKFEGVRQEKTVTKHNDVNNKDDSDDKNAVNNDHDDDDSNIGSPDHIETNRESRTKNEKSKVNVDENKTDKKSENRKRKLCCTDKDQQKTQSVSLNKQQKVIKEHKDKKQQKEHKVDRHEDTVSFITASDNREKKFKRKKNRQKKQKKTI